MIPLWLHFVIVALVLLRISVAIGWEDGPFDVFAKLRHRVGQKEWYGRGLNCPSCISFWLAWPLALLLPWYGWGWFVLLALALSGVTAAVVHR